MAVKRFRKRRNFRRRGRRVGGLASRVARIERTNRPEVKFLDTSLNGTVDNSPTYSISLADTSQGSDVFQRIGDKIKVSSMHMKFYVQASSSALTTPYTRVVLCLIRDMRPQLSVPAYYSGTPSQSLMAFNSSESLRNYTVTEHRYKIVKHWSFDISNSLAVNGGSAIVQGRHFDFYWKPKKAQIISYSNSSAASGYTNLYEQGTFSLVGYSTSSANVPSIVGYCRMTYTDA